MTPTNKNKQYIYKMCEQVIRATYDVCSEFIIPRGIDLDEYEHWVKYDTLFIDIGEEEPIEIEPFCPAYENDLKHPTDIEIITAEDCGLEDCYDDDDMNGKLIHRIRLKKVHKELIIKKEEEEKGYSSCPCCDNIYSNKDIDNKLITPCPTCYKCFVGDCSLTACDCE